MYYAIKDSVKNKYKENDAEFDHDDISYDP
jgi:hypothetical protein